MCYKSVTFNRSNKTPNKGYTALVVFEKEIDIKNINQANGTLNFESISSCTNQVVNVKNAIRVTDSSSKSMKRKDFIARLRTTLQNQKYVAQLYQGDLVL